MLLYVINVDSCIHVENYRIFFYEPVAKKHLEMFDASWNIASLTRVFGRVAEHINRRGFENRDYQVLVCVRRRESERWKETTLYAKAMVSQALEASGALSVITGAFTRKVNVLFQVEQPYYGTVPRTSVWEEELAGLSSLMDILEIKNPEQTLENSIIYSESRTDDDGETDLIRAWESALYEALEQEPKRQMDGVTLHLKERLYHTIEEEQQLKKEKEVSVSEEEIPEGFPEHEEEEIRQNACEYISHRLRSLFEGSGLNSASDVIYWPVPMESSRATRVSTLAMTDLIRSGQEITKERVRECFSENHPEYEKQLLERYRRALCGYRQQLQEKRERILQEISDGNILEDDEMQEEAKMTSALSLPEISAVLSDRIEIARQQLLNCAVSLRKSSRNEVKERIDDISQSLDSAFDGMEQELFSYKNEVKEYLYRELADSISINEEDGEYSVFSMPSGIGQMGDGMDETAAKNMISQWKQDMKLLTECTQLTGLVPTLIYLGISAAIAMIPYLLYQGNVWTQEESMISAIEIWIAVIGFIAGKRMLMNRYFVKSIVRSYAQLEKKLSGILTGYKDRAEGFKEEIRSLFERWQDAQKKQMRRRTGEKTAQLSAMRAWHLANMQKAIDGLDTFGPMEQGFSGMQKDPEIIRRILQPMDYFQKEQGNDVYWPVVDMEERKEEADE